MNGPVHRATPIHFGTVESIVEALTGQVTANYELKPLCGEGGTLTVMRRPEEVTQIIEHTTCEACCIALVAAIAHQSAALANTLAGLKKIREQKIVVR